MRQLPIALTKQVVEDRRVDGIGVTVTFVRAKDANGRLWGYYLREDHQADVTVVGAPYASAELQHPRAYDDGLPVPEVKYPDLGMRLLSDVARYRVTIRNYMPEHPELALEYTFIVHYATDETAPVYGVAALKVHRQGKGQTILADEVFEVVRAERLAAATVGAPRAAADAYEPVHGGSGLE